MRSRGQSVSSELPLKSNSFTSYTSNGFSIQDQESLATLAKDLGNNIFILLSNNDIPEIRNLYQGFIFKQILVKRSINANSKKRGSVKEVLIYK